MKAGEYVRVEDGGIGKIKEINQAYHQRRNNKVFTDNDTISTGWDGESVEWCFVSEVVKTSPRIIDLIEVGDYVNGNKIINISQDHCGRTTLIWGFDNGDFQCAFIIYEEDIKSIATKEQFEAMEYKCE